MINWKSGVVGIFALVVASVAAGQGQGPPPEDLKWRQKIDWLIQEVGVSEDGMTIRESIEGTDSILAFVVSEAIPAEQLDEVARGLKEVKETAVDPEELKKLQNEIQTLQNQRSVLLDPDLLSLVLPMLLALLIAGVGAFFRLSVKVEALSRKLPDSS